MRSHRQIIRSISLSFSLMLLLVTPVIGLSAYVDYHCDENMVGLVIAKADGDDRPANILMLSGGGSYGAWGAGFIDGWLKNSGSAVELDMITGVSAGSIVAVYVYLQDLEELHKQFLQIDTQDFYKKRFFLTIPFSSSIYSTKPQKKILMPQLFPDELIDRMAARSLDIDAPFLCVGSTKISTGEFIEWDLVKIAKAREYDLFRTVLQAAIAFPIMFEPVDINGELYADGGVRHDVFVDMSHLSLQHVITLEQAKSHSVLSKVSTQLLEDFNVLSLGAFEELSDVEKSEQLSYAARILTAIGYKPNVYIVINGKTTIGEDPNIERKLMPLTERSMGIMLKGSLYGSLYKIYYDMVKDETPRYWNFYYTQVPETFDKNCVFIQFKIECTTKLYNDALAAGSANDPWFEKFPAF